ncbi:sigma-54-dependent Fis family transcriptional regulator [Geothrix sp. 21YS21S-2]|uniref:sigma-54 interaction domain-containing protein n=1 Tax=Geothrix sp. 21YS21S-2 TaxID=3068893 RepID=UPI0027B9299B|nr:sigma 54-interacting transcriptional regulator [Geothrix sp. 21YS21S-2]
MAKLLSIFQDFTLLKQKATQLVFDCFDELAEGCLVVDKDVRVVMISERYAANLGVDPAAVLGQEIETFLPNSLMRQVVETGKPILLEIFEAQEHAMVVSRMPIRDEDGSVAGAMAFALYSDLEPLKPFNDRLNHLQTELAHAHKKLAEARRSRFTFSSFIGTSPGTMETKRLARRAAFLKAPVLLRGETGTGKELLAHAIHAGGPRAEGPFVTVNVAAIPDTLLEAEFFGVAPGAYTGADRKPRAGKFELAHGGTLFLDEIGDMPLALQGKLLRVLQDQEFEPLGSNRVVRVDVRIMAATNRDLAAMVKAGTFRKDLFYRLDVLSIPVPPLRERMGDLETLCEHLLEKIGHKNGTLCQELSPAAMELLERHAWPGNVRELENVLERAMLNTDAHTLEPSDFQELGGEPAAGASTLAGAAFEAERRALEAALEACHGNVAQAARRLGIGRTTFYRRLNAFRR